MMKKVLSSGRGYRNDGRLERLKKHVDSDGKWKAVLKTRRVCSERLKWLSVRTEGECVLLQIRLYHLCLQIREGGAYEKF